MPLITLDDAETLLRERFCRQDFRSHQFEIISALLRNADVFAVLPTGHGKSLTYQLPAVWEHQTNGKFTIVVSPLLALIADQVAQLHKLGIPAESLNSTLSAGKRKTVVSMFEHGAGCLLYVSPEQCFAAAFQKFLRQFSAQIARVVIDEAHCAVEWGADFRKDYARLGTELRAVLGDVPFVALTGTASPKMQKQIVKVLALRSPRVFVAPTARPHLHYEVRYIENSYDKLQDLTKFLRIYRLRLVKLRLYKRQETAPGGYPGCGIVYCRSRRATEEVAEQLNAELGACAVAYHAGLPAAERAAILEKWVRGDEDHAVVIATIAFGLGIDKPDTRFVVHFDLPQNMEAYVQQTGRGGRDRKACRCIMYFSGYDAHQCLKYAKGHAESEDATAATLALIKFAKNIDCCRHVSLGGYFGDQAEACDYACDFCKAGDRLRARFRDWQCQFD